MANCYFLVIVFSVYILFFPLAGADNHGVTFLYPTAGLAFNWLDTINVSWISPFQAPLLYAFCLNDTGTGGLLTKLILNVPPFNSSEFVLLNWPHMSSCYFDLRPNTSAGYGANSPTFLVNSTQRATPVTVGIAQPLSTSTLAASSAPSTATPTSDALATPSSSAKGADIGIGVALGIAVVAAFGLGIFFLRRWRLRRAIQGSVIPDHDSDVQKWGLHGSHNGQYAMKPVDGAMQKQPPQELASEIPAHELPSHEARSDGNEIHEMGWENSPPRPQWRFSWERAGTPSG